MHYQPVGYIDGSSRFPFPIAAKYGRLGIRVTLEYRRMLGNTPSGRYSKRHQNTMKTINKKCRGYNPSVEIFANLPEAEKVLGAEDCCDILNDSLLQHDWATAFEKALAKELERLGIFRPMIKAVPKVSKAETPNEYLKAWGGKFADEDAQAVADTVAFPPVRQSREEAPKAYLVSAAANLAPFKEDTEKLAKIGAKLAENGYGNEGDWDSVVIARAKLEWNTAKAALAEEKRKLAAAAAEYANL